LAECDQTQAIKIVLDLDNNLTDYCRELFRDSRPSRISGHFNGKDHARGISLAISEYRKLTYEAAAVATGRDPARNHRMMAQVCDLLDAAACLLLLLEQSHKEKDGRTMC
jgi:hypothetical protein